MIMKWADLEIGDILRYSSEYKRLVASTFIEAWRKKTDLTITRIIIKSYDIVIYFDLCDAAFHIDPETGRDLIYRYLYAGQAFEIVSLKQ